MRSVLIGGGGFIGRHIAKILSDRGGEVILIGRKKICPEGLPKLCHYISGDYGDDNILSEILQPGSDIIDLAYSTVPKTSFDDPLYDLKSNLPSSVKLFERATKIGVRRIVIVSSGGTVYGPVEKLPINENYPTLPISPYGITKLAVDRYAMMYHQNEALPIIVVRPANAYGEYQRAGTGQGFIATAIDSIISGREIEIYGERGTIRDYIHVTDVASGILAALDKGKIGRIYNIGTGIGTSNLEILSMLGDFACRNGLAVRKKTLPERRFDVTANVLDASLLHNDTAWTPQIQLKEGIASMWQSAYSLSLSHNL